MSKKGGRRKAEGGIYSRRSSCARTFPLPPSPLRPSSGVTLIELLIAIAIMATLSVMFLGASRAAMEHSRGSRTKMTISKLHTLLMEQWASYETRRVDSSIPTTVNEQMKPDYRLLSLRELLKYEMPDRWSDFVDINTNDLLSSRVQPTFFLEAVPTPAKIYFRRFMQVAEVLRNDPDKLSKLYEHQGAECLYLTVMYMTGDGEARTMFSAQDIGDKDGDGAPEFLDGWGNPIAWLRWPAGFVARSSLMSGDTDGDHDPFDPFQKNLVSAQPDVAQYSGRIQPFIRHLRDVAPTGGLAPGFRLVPLIYSFGSDGFSDINSSFATSVTSGDVLLDPYAIRPNGLDAPSFPPNMPAYHFGLPYDGNEDGDDNSIDNIHNHLQEGR